MKVKVSGKKVKESYIKVFKAGYCELPFLKNPRAYNSGIYGWNWDLYDNDEQTIAICSGYRNMPGKRIPDDILKNYINACEVIRKTNYLDYKSAINAVKAVNNNLFKMLEGVVV